jgi:hypothetical protein
MGRHFRSLLPLEHMIEKNPIGATITVDCCSGYFTIKRAQYNLNGEGKENFEDETRVFLCSKESELDASV